MHYRTNDVMTLVLVMVLGAALVGVGLLGRSPRLMEEAWPIVVGVGAAILLVCLGSVGFAATQPREIPCPYCKEKIVPKVRTLSGHLELSRLDEDTQ